MHLIGETITVTWKINTTDKTLVQADFDVVVKTPSGETFTDNNLTTFTAPTTTTEGEATYNFIATGAGLHKVQLGKGTASSFSNIDTVNIYVLDDGVTRNPTAQNLYTTLRQTIIAEPPPPTSGITSELGDPVAGYPYAVYQNTIKYLGNNTYVMQGNSPVAATNQRIYKSTDNGENWTEYNVGSNNAHSCLAYNPNTGTLLLVTNQRELYRSTDGGEIWVLITTFTGFAAQVLTYDHISDTFIYIGVSLNDNSAYSNDDGLNWTDIQPDADLRGGTLFYSPETATGGFPSAGFNGTYKDAYSSLVPDGTFTRTQEVVAFASPSVGGFGNGYFWIKREHFNVEGTIIYSVNGVNWSTTGNLLGTNIINAGAYFNYYGKWKFFGSNTEQGTIWEMDDITNDSTFRVDTEMTATLNPTDDICQIYSSQDTNRFFVLDADGNYIKHDFD